MAHQVAWYIDQQVLYLATWGTVDTEELEVILSALFGMVDESDHPKIHLIVDDAQVQTQISIAGAIPILRRYYKPRFGWVGTIGKTSAVIRLITGVLSQVMGMRLHRFPTIADALVFLKEYDKTLNWDIADQSVLLKSTEK